jgi:hypothetical protein
MTTDEYRALVEAGPAVVMVAKADMLQLLDSVKEIEKAVAYLKAARDMDKYPVEYRTAPK